MRRHGAVGEHVVAAGDSLAVELRQSRNQGDEERVIDGLAQVYLKAGRQRFSVIGIVAVARYRDRRRVMSLVFLDRVAKRADQIVAVLLRHGDVAYDDVGPKLVHGMQRLLSGADGEN